MEDRIPAPVVPAGNVEATGSHPAKPITVALDVKAFKSVLSLLCKVADRKGPKPATQSLLVRVRAAGLEWTANNLACTATVLHGARPSDATDGAAYVVEAHALKTAVGKAGKGTVELTLTADGATLLSSAGSVRIPSPCDASEMPGRPAFNPLTWYEFSADGLRRGIERTIGATDAESTRYATGAIALDDQDYAKSGAVLFVATDGRRLHVQRTDAFRSTSTLGNPGQRAECLDDKGKPTTLLLPLGIASVIPEALKLQIRDSEPRIACDADHVYVQIGDTLLSSRRLDGRFPHWREVCTASFSDRSGGFTASPSDVLPAFKACAAAIGKERWSASLLIYRWDERYPKADGAAVLEAWAEGDSSPPSYRCVLPTWLVGKTSRISLNPWHMADSLAPLATSRGKAPTVMFDFEGSGETCATRLTTDDGFEAWIMPLSHDGDRESKIKAEDKTRAAAVARHLADAGYTITAEPTPGTDDDGPEPGDDRDASRDVEATVSDPVPTADATPAEPAAEVPPAAETAHEATDVASSPEPAVCEAENRATPTENGRVDARFDSAEYRDWEAAYLERRGWRKARVKTREDRIKDVRERADARAHAILSDWASDERFKAPDHPGYRTAEEQQRRDRLAIALRVARQRQQAYGYPTTVERYAAARARIAARRAAQGTLGLDGAFDASEAWARDVEATDSHPALTAVPPAVDVVASTVQPEPLSVPPARVDVVASILATVDALVILFGEATAAAVLVCSEPIDPRRVLRCSTADVSTVDPLGLAASGLLDELADRVSARRSERRTAAALRDAARSALVGATTDAGTAVATALAEAWDDEGPDDDGPEPGDDGDSTRDVEATDSHPEPATSWPRASIEDRIKATRAELEAAQAELARLRDAAAVVCTKHTQDRIYSLMRRVEYLERRASRADRLRERAERARARAQAHYQASNDAVAGIEFGQPILVGHHSERRHRRDLARSASHMDKMVEATREAERLDSRADAAEGNEAIRSDDPGAIDAYRAKIEALRERHAVAKRVNADLRKAYGKHEGRWKRIDGPDRDRLHACVYSIGAPMWAVKELDSYMHAFPWFPSLSLDSYTREIKRCEERIKALEAASVAADLEWTGEGCTVRLSHERGRAELQVQHDRKPPAEVREQLKSLGFRWVRSLGFWSASDRYDRRAFAVGLTGGSVPPLKFKGDDETAGPDPDDDGPGSGSVEATDSDPGPPARDIEALNAAIAEDAKTRAATMKRIKAALKRRSGKDWSVTGGRGTAYGWITVDAPPARRTWQHHTTKSPERPSPEAYYIGSSASNFGDFDPMSEDRIAGPDQDPYVARAMADGMTVEFHWYVNRPDQEFGFTGPEDRVELARLLGHSRAVHYQGESIASSTDHYIAAMQAAEGLEVTVSPERYWD